MEFERFCAGHDELSRRLDRVSKRILEAKGVTGNVFSLLRKGLIRINGRHSLPSYLIKEGDVICVARFLLEGGKPHLKKISSPCATFTPLDTIDLIDSMATTLFRNDHLWILNKKPGVCVQPDGRHSSLFDVVAACTIKSSLSFKPGCLHRIDQGTSGIVVFSQSATGARWFSSKLRGHTLKRSYLAIAQGHLARGEIVFDKAIAGKAALTCIHLLATGSFLGQPLSLVEAQIETGRKHQIRIHLAQNGNPLLGDTRYGGSPLQGSSAHQGRFFLHAAYLRLGENPLGAPLEVHAPVPEDFRLFERKTFGEPPRNR